MKFRTRTVFLITILVLYVILVQLSGGHKEPFSMIDVNVCYLYNEQTKSMEGVLFEASEVDRVGSVIEKLYEGDMDKGLKGTIPKAVEVIYYLDDSRNVTINFNDYYYVLDPRNELILRTSLIRSLTSYGNIDSVEIFVEGIPMRDQEGRSVGRYEAKDIYLSLDETFQKSNIRSLVVYYPDMMTKELVFEHIEIPLDTNQKVEESLIKYMMLDSTHSIFPKGVQLLDVYTHEDVCYVDFNEAMELERLPEGISTEVLIYSIVNSLVDLPDVTRVQFFIEGKLIPSFRGTMDLKKLLSKNYSIIK